MSYWMRDYKREERPRIEPGDYRVRVVDVEETVSKRSGANMLVIKVSPNGYDHVKINHYIVNNEFFNQNMTSFFDSFNVEDGNLNLATWIGATGAARLKEDGEFMRVHFFIHKDKQGDLPPWIGDMPERQTIDSSFVQAEIEEDDLPFA